ncbi:hypothetical protein CPB85DRAFT_360168 [Mucidula mucida]|nr:hypothetical protein CPB85DRAFT_360168 [Mucidula mucida]
MIRILEASAHLAWLSTQMPALLWTLTRITARAHTTSRLTAARVASLQSTPEPTPEVAVVPDDDASVSSTVAIDAPLPAVPADTGVPPVDASDSDDAPTTHDAPSTDVSSDESVPQEKAEIVQRRHALRRQGCRGQGARGKPRRTCHSSPACAIWEILDTHNNDKVQLASKDCKAGG